MDADISSILCNSELGAPLAIRPLFNPLLSFQRRNLKAKQLGLRFSLPRISRRNLSQRQETIKETQDGFESNWKRWQNRSIRKSTQDRLAKKRERMAQLVRVQCHSHVKPELWKRPEKSNFHERNNKSNPSRLTLDSVTARTPDITGKNSTLSTQPVSLSSDQVPKYLRRVSPILPKVVQSIHTLDLPLPNPISPIERRLGPHRKRTFVTHITPQKMKLPVSNESGIMQFRSPGSPSRSSSPYNISRCFPFDVPISLKLIHKRRILLDNIRQTSNASAMSTESEGSDVLVPVFS